MLHPSPTPKPVASTDLGSDGCETPHPHHRHWLGTGGATESWLEGGCLESWLGEEDAGETQWPAKRAVKRSGFLFGLVEKLNMVLGMLGFEF